MPIARPHDSSASLRKSHSTDFGGIIRNVPILETCSSPPCYLFLRLHLMCVCVFVCVCVCVCVRVCVFVSGGAHTAPQHQRGSRLGQARGEQEMLHLLGRTCTNHMLCKKGRLSMSACMSAYSPHSPQRLAASTWGSLCVSDMR